MTLPYDDEDPISIEKYARTLLNRTLREVYQASQTYNMGARGALGQAVEKLHFKYQPNNIAAPDFPKAGLELKVTPIKTLKNGELVAKERLVLNIIDFMVEHSKSWEESSFWQKNKRLLLMFYLHHDNAAIYDLYFRLIGIWDYPEKDLLIIKNDWKIIVNKIRNGEAHLISEGDTMYLGACTKGGGHGGDFRSQPFSSELAKQRAYSLKKKYLDIIISTWRKDKRLNDIEPIVKNVKDLSNEKSFEQLVIEKFAPYIGKSPTEITKALGVKINPNAKNFFSTLSLRVLGVKTKKVEEFEKADITLKTIRLKHNNMPKEDISFPYFKYKEIVEETWYESTFRSYLEKKFFFVIYKFNKKGELRLAKVMFWNMPARDIDSYAKLVWERTVEQINNNKAGDLPKKRENYACHVRPHGRNAKDTDETPNGVMLVKKSFWLNSKYIRDQILDKSID
ncbi:MAG: DNA mismatch repair protein [Anaerolineae bacterium]|nr:DNA mismatch repair protein [Anaerolineae bacterium]